MPTIYAYAIAGALIASTTTWCFLEFPGLLIWSAFIGWAGFLHSGGARSTIPTTITCMLFGVVMAWLFALFVAGGYAPLPMPVVAAILVAIIAPFMIWVSKFALFSVVPASFYGFAASFAYLAQTPGKFSSPVMLSLSLENVLFIVPISMAIGVGLGYLQTVVASKLLASSLFVAEG